VDRHTSLRVERVEQPAQLAVVDGLATVLLDTVDEGNSVGFLTGFTLDDARRWWQATIDDPQIMTWVALDGERIVGCVRLILAREQNGLHRAEVGKMLVHRDSRRLGIGVKLLEALEAQAIREGRWLLVLDTLTDSAAEVFYQRLGWSVAGVIPDYATDTFNVPEPATFYWKRLPRPE